MTTTFGGVQRWVDQNGLLVKTWLPLLEHTPFHALEQKLPTIGPDMGDYERQMYWTGMRSPLWTPRAANGYARSASSLMDIITAELLRSHLAELTLPPQLSLGQAPAPPKPSVIPALGFVPPAFLTWMWKPYLIGLGGDPKPKAPKPDVDFSRTEPFLGWKTLGIKVTKKGKLKLVGVGASARYGVDATARCNYFHDHVAPDWDCTCGFYALTDKPDYPEYGRFIARVELFGTVIEAQHGYRASRQRVLSLEVFRECQAEDRVGDHCDREADGFQVTKGGNVWPVCATHAPLGYTELADLRAKLGTEVKWVAA